MTIHLSEHHGDASRGATIFVPVTDIDALHGELHDRNYRYGKSGVKLLGWGEVLEVFDPFSNRIRFCELAKQEGEAGE